MFPNLKKYLKLLNTLNLDPNEYMITGSGSLAVHGIRDCADLDILVTDSYGEALKSKYPNNFHETSWCDKIEFEGVEFMFNFKGENRPFSTELQLAEADVIDGKKYQIMEKVKFYKREQAREKDLEDLKLIEAWENLQKNQKSV